MFEEAGYYLPYSELARIHPNLTQPVAQKAISIVRAKGLKNKSLEIKKEVAEAQEEVSELIAELLKDYFNKVCSKDLADPKL